MALGKFGFIVTGAGLDTMRHRVVMSSPAFEMIALGVTEASQGPAAAQILVDEGVELIELCGGFGPLWTARVIEAIGGAVPVGSVSYGSEAITPMHNLFK